jgi:tetratricopeptide (TPR) repeat protein
MLLPVMGFVWITFQQEVATADWWQYLAAPGIFAAISAGLVTLISASRPLTRQFALTATCLIVVALVIQTSRRCAIYESMETYSRAVLAEEPGIWTLQNNLGVTLKEQGRLDEAAIHYRMALRDNPRFATAMHNLGNVLMAQEKWSQARSQFEAALLLDPKNSEIMTSLACVYFSEGKIADALGLNVRAINIDPTNPDRYSAFGEKLQVIGRNDRAVMCFSNALLLKPGDARSSIGLARALLASGQPDDAAKICEQVFHLALKEGNAPVLQAVSPLRQECRVATLH